jgi:hypothetical protein
MHLNICRNAAVLYLKAVEPSRPGMCLELTLSCQRGKDSKKIRRRAQAAQQDAVRLRKCRPRCRHRIDAAREGYKQARLSTLVLQVTLTHQLLVTQAKYPDCPLISFFAKIWPLIWPQILNSAVSCQWVLRCIRSIVRNLFLGVHQERNLMTCRPCG